MEAWTQNPLLSRTDLLEGAIALLKPLLRKYSKGKAAILALETGAHFDQLAAQLEGFSRVMWAVAAIKAGFEEQGASDEVKSVLAQFVENFQDGVGAGTDPDSPEYWGYPESCDQRLVEMAALGYCLFMCPAAFWDPLPQKTKRTFATWLYSINEVGIVSNNWLFFRVLVNVGLRTVGEKHDEDASQKALAQMNSWYLGDGWYYDGAPRQLDYYIPFAFHFYGLIYSVHASEWDPINCAKFRQRAAKFADTFYSSFADSGAGIPFGRSLTYRFAHSSIWAAMAYADLEGEKIDSTTGKPVVNMGVIKHLLLQNLRYWRDQPFLLDDGSFSVGYCYPNLFMSEEYNSANSPYWAMKSMLALAVPSQSRFWTATEPEKVNKPFITQSPFAGQMYINDDYGHTYALSAKQHADWFRNQNAKYCKFVYSSRFGFSVSQHAEGLPHLAADCHLAITTDGELYTTPGVTQDYGMGMIAGRMAVSGSYSPVFNKSVAVSAWMFAPESSKSAYHVRILKIVNSGSVDATVADGGFSVSVEGKGRRVIRSTEVSSTGEFRAAGADWALCKALNAGVSGLKSGYTTGGLGGGKAQHADPNTNLVFPRSAFPSLSYTVPAGETTWIMDYVFAIPGEAEVVRSGEWIKLWEDTPDESALLEAIKSL
ncbi:hypothetical protein BZA70DRAFT_199777 [Myxozyma melibiosi]|uniref:DUF2264 domain-containing protein n=1 Tax=Myxozyma melibiosi TaxID=54550 RepID=A0ABR1F2J6_9ASCO